MPVSVRIYCAPNFGCGTEHSGIEARSFSISFAHSVYFARTFDRTIRSLFFPPPHAGRCESLLFDRVERNARGSSTSHLSTHAKRLLNKPTRDRTLHTSSPLYVRVTALRSQWHLGLCRRWARLRAFRSSSKTSHQTPRGRLWTTLSWVTS